MTPQQIEALASLWKLAAVFVAGAGLVIFRAPIRSWLNDMTSLRLRRGETEVTVERGEGTLGIEQKAGRATAEAPTTSGAPEPAHEPAVPAQLEPSDWMLKMLDAFFERNFDEAESAFNSLKAAEPNALERIRHEASYFALRYMYASDTRALESLKSLSENPEMRSYVYSWIAQCYRRSGRAGDAIAAYEQAIASSRTDEERAGHIVSLAGCIADIGKVDEAMQRLVDALRTAACGPNQARLYEKVAELEKQRGNAFNAALAREMVAFNRPEDTSARFAAAYAQSDADLLHISCTNYSTLLSFDPSNTWALNNQGVMLNKLGMPIRAVAMYRRAAERSNTLAMANLAYKFLSEGFAREAEELIDAARKEPSPHENVGRAMAAVAEAKEKEDGTFQAIVQRGVQQQQFFHSYFPALLISEAIGPVPTNEWFVKSTPAQVTMEGSDLVVEWGNGSDRRRIQGMLKNRAGVVRVRKWEKSLFLDEWRFDEGVRAFACFDESIGRLIVLSTEGDENLSIEVVRRPGSANAGA
jgi:tetratricopeptide (TPR) repeat protein